MEVGVAQDNWELRLKIYRNCLSLHTKEPEIIEHATPDSAVFPRAHNGSPKIKHYLCPQSMFSCGFSIIITIFVGLLRGMRPLIKIYEASSTKMSISLRLSLFLLLIRSSQPCLNSAAATLQPLESRR